MADISAAGHRIVYQNCCRHGDGAIVGSGLPWMASHHTQHHPPWQIPVLVTMKVIIILPASEYHLHPATAQFLCVFSCHRWWRVLASDQYSWCSVGSLSMAVMIHGSFFNPSIVCCACKIIISGVMNIMEVLSMTNLRGSFQWCTQIYLEMSKIRSWFISATLQMWYTGVPDTIKR